MSPRARRGTAGPSLLRAAQELFGERPYHEVTTREIAERAGVSETLIFRYFTSKATLFGLAVLTPAMEVMDGLVRSWTTTGGERDKSAKDLVESFVAEFYDAIARNRGLLLAVMHVATSDSEFEGSELRQSVAALMARVSDVIAAFTASRSARAMDPQIMSRTVILLVGATAAFWPYTFELNDASPSESRVKAELAQMILRNVDPGGGAP